MESHSSFFGYPEFLISQNQDEYYEICQDSIIEKYIFFDQKKEQTNKMNTENTKTNYK